MSKATNLTGVALLLLGVATGSTEGVPVRLRARRRGMGQSRRVDCVIPSKSSAA
jgi:hypothetical protein